MLDDEAVGAGPDDEAVDAVQRRVLGDAAEHVAAGGTGTHSAPGGTAAHRVLPEQSALTRARSRMDRALAAARDTPAGDIPVGAVVFGPDGEPVSAATNRRQADNDPTAHAEVLALRAAAEKLGRWRLEDCELVVTLEPCVMCAGAAVAARVGSIVFGAWEPKTGACGSYVDAVRAPGALYVPEVRGGVAEYESQRLIHSFFSDLRR